MISSIHERNVAIADSLHEKDQTKFLTGNSYDNAVTLRAGKRSHILFARSRWECGDIATLTEITADKLSDITKNWVHWHTPGLKDSTYLDRYEKVHGDLVDAWHNMQAFMPVMTQLFPKVDEEILACEIVFQFMLRTFYTVVN